MLTNQIPQSTQPLPQTDTIANTVDMHQPQSIIWSAFIPRINKIFLVPSLLLVFGLDLIILISSFSLIGFWLEMLAVFGVFLLLFYFENKILRKKFADTKTPLDPFIYVLVVIRNIVIFLNFIPFIQLLGMTIGMFTGIPYLLIYSLLIWLRYKRS